MPPEETESMQMPADAVVRDNSKLFVPGAVVIGAAIIGLSLIIGLSHGTGGAAQGGSGAPAQPTVNVKNVKTAGDPYMGNLNAKLTMTYWSDYQCPFCKAFEVGGVPQINGKIPAPMPALVKKYVDTGKLKIVFKDFQFLGKDSTTAAEYGRAIWDLYPTQFYACRTAMFVAQDAEGDQGFGNAATIDALIKAKFPQMDDAKIRQQLTANKAKYDAAIEADKAEGGSFGVNGTPGFIVGTTFIGGLEALASFESAIDAQLK